MFRDPHRRREPGRLCRFHLATHSVRRRRAGPGEHDVGRVAEGLVALRAQHGEILALLPPRQHAVDRRRRIEHTRGAGGRVVDLHAVSRSAVNLDRERQQCTPLRPRELAHVAERHLAAALEILHDEIGGALAFGRIAPHGEVAAVAAEAELTHVLHDLGDTRREIADAHRAPNRLLVLRQAIPFGRRHADGVGDPPRVAGERGCGRVEDRDRGVACGGAEPELVLLVDAADPVGEPLPVRRQRRRAERFPLRVVGGLHGGSRLAEHRDGKHRGQRKPGDQTTVHVTLPGETGDRDRRLDRALIVIPRIESDEGSRVRCS